MKEGRSAQKTSFEDFLARLRARNRIQLTNEVVEVMNLKRGEIMHVRLRLD